jgi:hypothetical protein
LTIGIDAERHVRVIMSDYFGDLMLEAGVPRVFVVNAADKDWKLLGSAIEALVDFGEVIEPTLRYHEGHPSSMVQGLTAAESTRPCASGGPDHE